jgi:Mrp family chromosome partitioning ATPase
MGFKHKIIVLSGKGGVGKSTVSANLAMALAKKGYKVGLLDCDLHGPSIPKILGVEGERLLVEGNVIQPFQINENLKAISIGFALPDSDSPVIWRGPLKMKAIKEFLEGTNWGDLDYLIVDLPPGTGDEPLSIIQLISDIDGAIIVTTPQDIALLSVRKSINFVKKMGVKVIGIIENMSGFTCPHCGKTTYIFKKGGGEKTARELGLRFLGRIPIDLQIVEEGDLGKSFIDAESVASKVFIDIADSIDKIINKGGG